MPKHSIWGTRLAPILAVLSLSLWIIKLFAREEACSSRQVVGVDEKQATIGVEGIPAPR
jgi:hypothetical protein